MDVLDTYQTMINIVNYEKMEGLFRVTAHVYTAYLVLTVMRHLEFYYTYCDYVYITTYEKKYPIGNDQIHQYYIQNCIV